MLLLHFHGKLTEAKFEQTGGNLQVEESLFSSERLTENEPLKLTKSACGPLGACSKFQANYRVRRSPTATLAMSLQIPAREQSLSMQQPRFHETVDPPFAEEEEKEEDMPPLESVEPSLSIDVSASPDSVSLPRAARQKIIWWKDATSKKLVVLASVSLAFVVAEIILAVRVGSLTLLSDALHNLADVGMLFVALLVKKYEGKNRTDKSTFGWVRGSVIGALIASVFILGVFFLIAIQVVERFIQLENVEQPMTVVWTGLAAFAVNLLGVLLFANGEGHGHSHGGAGGHHGHSHGGQQVHEPQPTHVTHEACGEHHHAHGNVFERKPEIEAPRVQDLNSRAVFIHFLGDAAGSLGAILVGLVIQFSSSPSRQYVDPVVSAAMVVFVCATSMGVIRDSVRILMHHVPSHIPLDPLRKELEETDGVLAVHELHVWALTENKSVASVHVLCVSDVDVKQILSAMKSVFHKYNIHISTIQPESVVLESYDGHPVPRIQLGCEAACDPSCDPNNSCCDPASTQIGDAMYQAVLQRRQRARTRLLHMKSVSAAAALL
jgi:zinc transporter 1